MCSLYERKLDEYSVFWACRQFGVCTKRPDGGNSKEVKGGGGRRVGALDLIFGSRASLWCVLGGAGGGQLMRVRCEIARRGCW